MNRSTVVAVIMLALFIACSEANAQMGAIAAVDEPAERPKPAEGGGASVGGGAGGSTARTTGTRRGSRTTGKQTTAKKPAAPRKPAAPAKYDGFVVGDKYTFLNFEVVSAEKPYHTRAAKASGAKGLVQVEVLIGVDGSVLTAKGRTGNKELWPEAERAALASKFNRPTFGGKPARAIGFLVYRFGPADD
ncbi:MAG: hypothetical protein IPM21_07415 [Acidobacteria bacterium]|nr:hypothetical protein [Acidobacteriota bacterium]